MPAHATNGVPTTIDVSASGVACPISRTPQSELDGALCDSDASETTVMTPPASNNTALGMSMTQEDSMYLEEVEKEKTSIELTDEGNSRLPILDSEDTPAINSSRGDEIHSKGTVSPGQRSPPYTQLRTPSPDLPRSLHWPGLNSLDAGLSRKGEAITRDFSKRMMPTLYPSSLFQVNSKYTGTQQSDRQIYKVEVTILTVDVHQCTTSGYLQICGLTPDHPTLTTFFTGEIIGGPDQKYSFRTKDPAWGASDKTDMTHWARFPAWRSLSSHAKLNMNFTHPVDNSPWWQQEHIFMRWKEHFLVPDYKLKSIQGASFEGFYYICLNQVEGKISGIYFHSKSEK